MLPAFQKWPAAHDHDRSDTGEAFGSELRGTYWHYRRSVMPYHIDYLFVPMTWLKDLVSFELGDYDAWCASGLSDHAPLSAEFRDAVSYATLAGLTRRQG
jgi:hypothetical protein